MKNINWNDVQKFYDDNHNWKDTTSYFKISNDVLTKAIKKGLIKLRTKSDANKLGHVKSPQKHTDETKSKLSEIRKKYLLENPDKVPYLLNHYSKGPSYPEKYFDEILSKSGLIYEKYYRIGLYELDFAFLDKKIDLEIDGSQHILDNRILESDLRRDDYMKINGWKVIRINWKDYLKLDMEKRKIFIENLLLELEK